MAARSQDPTRVTFKRRLPQLPAGKPADSWHGREPKITQTAGTTGCHGRRRWALSQDTWSPVLAAASDLVTLGESRILSEGG